MIDRPPPDDEVDEEIRFHLERRARKLENEGVPPDEARREAMRRFGDVDEVRMRMERETRRRRREGRFRARLDALRQDVRYGVRQLMRSPVFAGVVILTIALGIGANTAIFSVVDHILLRPLPYPESDELVALWADVTRRGGPEDEWLSYANWADLRDGVPAFESAAVWGFSNLTMTATGQEPRSVSGAVVSAGMFTDVLRIEPALGRAFTPDDDVPGAPNVLLVSHDFWQEWSGGDPDAIGSSIVLNDVPYEVVGVMPEGFRAPFAPNAQYFQLFQVDPAVQQERRGGFSFRSIVRLTDDTDIDQARAQADVLAERLEATYPESNTGMAFTLRPLRDDIVRTAETGLWVVMGAVGLVLLVTCVNVANLLLARASSRTAELSVRAAVGAGRRRIVGQLMSESFVLAGIGGTVGIGLGVLGTRLLVALAPAGTPRIEGVTTDGRVLLFSLGITLLAGFAFGTLPALRLARADLHSALREGGRDAHGGRSGLRVRNALVTVQVALALVVLVGAGLLLRSFGNLRSVDLGYDPDDVLSFFVNLPSARYGDGDAMRQFAAEIDPALAAIPGVVAVGSSGAFPLSGFDGDASFHVENRPLPEPGQDPAAWIRRVTPGYDDAVDLRVLSGRFIEDGDVEGGHRVIAINETFAERHFVDENPMGQRVTFGDPTDPDATWWEIVGVVGDTRHFSVRDDRREAAYLSFRQAPSASNFFAVEVAAGRDPLSVVPDVRRVLADIDPSLAPRLVQPMRTVVEGALAPDRFLAVLLTLFAVVTLTLAVVGLYGVISYSVAARLREVGVRMALGAEGGRIGRLVVGRSVLMASIGVVLGGGLAVIAAPGLRSLLYGVEVADPVTFGGTALLLVAVAGLAAAVPALRAARVDPVKVLRAD